jgi:TP901 family phage tail tape measure protein
MAEDEVGVKVSADDTGLQSGFDSAAARTKRFATEQERQAATASKAWQKASKDVGKALLAFSAAGVAGFAVAGNQAAMFETNMRRVNTIAKLSEDRFSSLTAQVQAMGDRMKTTQSVDKMAAALYQIYSAGLEGEKALKTLEAATVAADAGAADLATTADVLTTAMIAYKLPAEKAGYVSDILFKTVDKGKVSFSQLASSIGPVLTVASKFGVSLEEVGAAYAQLSLTAASPAEAATALERAITQLAAPTPEVRKQLDSLGVSYGRNAIAAKGFMGVLQEFKAASGGSDSELRRLLSSSEALKVGLDLATDGGEAYAEKLKAMGTAAGAAAAANDEMAKDFKFSWEVLAKEVTNAAVKVGQVLLPFGQQLLDLGITGARSFNSMSLAGRESAIGMGVGAVAIGGITGALLLLAPNIAALPKAFSLARGAVALMAGSLNIGLVAAIAGVGLAMAGLVKAWTEDWGGMRTTAEQGAQAIREALIGIKAPGFTEDNLGSDDARDIRARRLAGLPVRSSLTAAGSANGIQLASPRGGFSNTSGISVSLAKGGKAPVDPNVQRLLDNMGKQQANLDAINAKAKAEMEDAGKKTKKRAATEEDLRLAMVAQAKALVRAEMKTSEVREAMGGLGTDSTQCANTMRLISKKAGLVFPVDMQPWDKALLGSGEGVGSATADSLFGGKVGKFFRDRAQARAGDLAFYDTPNRPGVVQHVEMVDDQGGTIGASSSAGKVVQRRGLGNVGDRRLLGFVSPTVYKGKRSGAQAGLGDMGDYEELLKERRADFLAFVETDLDESTRELFEKYKKALMGARTDSERQAVSEKFGQARNDLLVANDTTGGMEASAISFGREMSDPNAGRNMVEELIQQQRDYYAQRKELGIEDTKSRIAEIEMVLKSDLVANDTRRSLEVEKRQLAMEWQQQELDNADQRVERTLEDLEFERSTGQISLEEKLARLQQETVAFAGSINTRRQLLLEIHNTEVQLTQERNALADQVFQSFEQGLQGMLQQSLSSQTSFKSTFTSLWKSIANQVLAELVKMIVKALALQAIMRGIFGFFTAGASEAIGLGAGGLDLVSAPLGIAHTGGTVVPGGIASFHTGGGVGLLGAKLRSDEVLAKLQVGEVVLSRDQVAAVQSSEGPGGGGAPQVNLYQTNHISNDMDLARVSDYMTRDLRRGLAEQR